MKETFKKIVSAFLVICIFSLCFPMMGTTTVVSAATRINEKTKTINAGGTFKLKILGTTKKVTWTSSNKDIAKVSSKGTVTAIKAGTAKITAKVGTKKYVCKVTVKPYINKSSAWVSAGKTVKLKIKGANKTVKWTSNNTKVATVSSKGVVTTKAKGDVVIKATMGKKVFKCKITVWGKDTEEAIEYIQDVVARVNKARVNKGLNKLKLNTKLCEAAMIRAKELEKEFSHVRPNGEECFTVYSQFGFEVNSYKGENIAYGYVNPEKVMEGWMASTGHKANIMSENFEEIGVGVVNVDGYRYWVQLFYGL